MKTIRPFWFCVLVVVGLAVPLRATVDVALQMQLGNPSSATINPANHQHYLIQRAQYALDYSDALGQPLWVSWDLTAGDVGPAARSTTYFTDTSLPATFYAVTDNDYVGVGAINFNRGHMCPSEDRTATVADNQQVFLMTNIVPQAGDNNQGPWEAFESYCRTLAAAGNELLIMSGPSGFTTGSLLPSGKAAIAAYVWKIAVVVPVGSGTALSRITAATRVIALKLPNTNGIRSVPWQNYVTTVNQIQTDTGFTFFTALPDAVATALRAVTDSASTAGSPAITTQPAAQSTLVGGSATFTVVATGNAPLSYQWSRNGTAITGATSTTLTLTNVTAADFTTYSVLISNAVGSVVSNAVALNVASPAGGPSAIYWDFATAAPTSGVPSDRSVTVGDLVQGNNNGTTTLLTTTSISGSYTGASAGNNAGAAARTGTLNRAAGGSAYFEFTLTPAAGKLAWVTGLAFGARSTGTGPQAFAVYTSADSYALPVAGGALANNSVWSLQSPALAPVAGTVGAPVTFRIYGYNGTGNASASTANWRIDDLSVSVAALGGTPPSTTRLVNLSSRARTGVSEQAAFAGFAIAGQGSKTLLIRAVGPGLTGFGLPGALAQPRLELIQNTTSLRNNAGWTTGGGSAAVAAAATISGAFPLGTASADSAVLVTLAPGNYSAVASAADGRVGTGLVEIYDVPSEASGARLVNISTRATVGAGLDTLIAGVAVSGTLPQRVLIRAAGPALAQFGLTSALARPQLALYSGDNVIAQNAGWTTGSDPAAITLASTQTAAFAFAAGSQDAALIATLAPGNYTVQVTSADTSSGTALVEIYELP